MPSGAHCSRTAAISPAFFAQAGGGPVEGQPLVLHQETDLLEGFDILRMEKAVALAVSDRMDKTCEIIAPVTDCGSIFAKNVSDFPHRINRLCHIFAKIHNFSVCTARILIVTLPEMSKLEKYILNPDTLMIEIHQEDTHRWVKLLLVVLGGAALFVLYLWFYVSVLEFDLPKTALLKRQNALWASRLERMDARMDRSEELLRQLSVRDDRIYRSVYGLDEIPLPVREGVSGQNRHQDLEKGSTLYEVTTRLDRLSWMAYIQSRSFDDILDLSRSAGDRAAHIPAIPPMSTDPSTYRMTSPFGNRADPLLGYTKRHTGMDFACPPGNPIYATGDGVVSKVAHEHKGYGNHVEIDHGFGYRTRYAHMSEIIIQQGDTLRRGDCIGYSGRSGRITGPHLHYEVHYRKDYVNPANYMDLDIPVKEYYEMVRKPAKR